MSDKATVAVRNLSKTYYLSRGGSERSLFRVGRRTKVEALKNTSFATFAGESVGILGHNGSGKSTLLRLIAGSESPSSGEVFVSSQPTLLGVSAALQPYLTGRLNVRLGLLAMGLSSQETNEIQDPVLEWAGLENAADRPLRTYSSGMAARLKFSIATAVRREILLIDEALSTGDATFAEKAEQRMDEFLSGSGTVFVVSHVASSIRKYCSRVIWLNEGEIIADGLPEDVFVPYLEWTKLQASGNTKQAQGIIDSAREDYSPWKILFDSEAIDLLQDFNDH